MVLHYDFRTGAPTDHAYIYQTWIKSFRESPFAFTLTDQVYNSIQSGKMETIIHTSNITIACPPSDSDIIYGYVVHSLSQDNLTLVHYVYVRDTLRKHGIAQSLLAQINHTSPTIFTDVTQELLAIRRKHDLPFLTVREYQNLHLAPDFSKAFEQWIKNENLKNKRKRETK